MSDALWAAFGGGSVVALVKLIETLIGLWVKRGETADAADAKKLELQSDDATAIRKELREEVRGLKEENKTLHAAQVELQRQNAEMNARQVFQDAQLKAAAEREALRQVERQDLAAQVVREQTARMDLERLLNEANKRIAELERQLALLRPFPPTEGAPA